MRDIHRLERLTLDAIENLNDPTMRDVHNYIAQRRRVWFWTGVGIIVALLRLEGQGQIEARRARDAGGKVRWIYRVRTEEGRDGEQCRACSSSATVLGSTGAGGSRTS